jgi:hypothetical protein
LFTCIFGGQSKYGRLGGGRGLLFYERQNPSPGGIGQDRDRTSHEHDGES